MPSPVRFPRTYADRDYWLCRCEGFDVYRRGRRLGKVEELRFLSRHDRPDALIVRGRLPRPHQTAVPIEEVEAVEPGRRRVVLHDPSEIGTANGSPPEGSTRVSAVLRAQMRWLRRHRRAA